MKHPSNTVLIWLRRTFRADDNPLLQTAVKEDAAILPVYIHPEAASPTWAPGGASRWWLHQSLKGFGEALGKKGSRLVVRRGDPVELVRRLAEESGARSIYYDRGYEPEALRQEEQLAEALSGGCVELRGFNTNLLFEPGAVLNKARQPYKVFTPFWKACLALGEPEDPRPAPRNFKAPGRWPASQSLGDLALEPKPDGATGLRSTWSPGRTGALEKLQTFLEAVQRYPVDRDRPDIRGTSMLSPHLHFGEISPREIWSALREACDRNTTQGLIKGAESYLRQLGWREFAHHLLYHFPRLTDLPLRSEFAHYPWNTNPAWLTRWQQGQTGYPIVDAGMRELRSTGWMHNRVRMITASFLVKDLLIPWQEGAQWFWDTLVDADLANNSLGWQWVAGCGADAAPYFRIFNPVTQGQKFDPRAVYIRRWVPELASLPDRWIHQPWKTPDKVLEETGVELGKHYPHPLVDHGEARDRALEGYTEMLERKYT